MCHSILNFRQLESCCRYADTCRSVSVHWSSVGQCRPVGQCPSRQSPRRLRQLGVRRQLGTVTGSRPTDGDVIGRRTASRSLPVGHELRSAVRLGRRDLPVSVCSQVDTETGGARRYCARVVRSNASADSVLTVSDTAARTG